MPLFRGLQVRRGTAGATVDSDEAFRINLESVRPGQFVEPDAAAKHHPKGRFYRPELYSRRERIIDSTGFRVGAIAALVLALGGLIVGLASASAIL